MIEMELQDRVKQTSGTAVSGEVFDVRYNQDDRDLIRLGKKPVLKVIVPFSIPLNF